MVIRKEQGYGLEYEHEAFCLWRLGDGGVLVEPTVSEPKVLKQLMEVYSIDFGVLEVDELNEIANIMLI